MPGYRVANLDQEGIKERHLCCHCGLLLRDAMQTSCGHLYCQSCLGNLFQNEASEGKCVRDQCVICPGEVFPDNFLRREILALIVRCPLLDDGCRWIGEVRHLEYHISSCDFRQVPCVCLRCCVLVKRCDMGYHLQHECIEASRLLQPYFNLRRTGASPEGEEPFSEITTACGERKMKPVQRCVDLEDDSTIELRRRLTSLENRMEEHEAFDQERFENLTQTASLMKESFDKLEEQLTENRFLRDEQSMAIELLCQNFRRLRDYCRNRCGQQPCGSGAGFLDDETGRRLTSDDGGIAEHQALLQETLENLTQIVRRLHEVFGGIKDELDENDRLCDDGRIGINFVREALRRLQGCFTNMEDTGIQPSSQMPGRLSILENGRDNTSRQVVALQRQLETAQETIRRQEGRLESIEHTLALRNVALADTEEYIRQQEVSCYDGLLLWKVSDYARRRKDAVTGRQTSFYSPTFYTSRHGYKMCARLYLNGDGMGKGTHISVFFVVMRGQFDALLRWPFTQKVTMMLLDQDNVEHVIDAFRPDPKSSSFQRPRREMNVASGCPLFCPLAELSNHAYVRDDTMFLKIIVDTSDL